MQFHMLFQVTGEAETHWANGTAKRFLPRVNSHVSFKQTRLCKSFITLITSIRPFSCVKSHMDNQQTCFSERFSALIARMGLLILILCSLPGGIVFFMGIFFRIGTAVQFHT
jgi:hypothetical protein